MKKIIIKLFLIFCTTSIIAQNNNSVIGIVQDSTDVALEMATVVLLNPTDSTMVGYSMTNENGNFYIGELPQGNYNLQITYIGYGTFEQKVEVNQEKIDLGIIQLSSDNELLKEVVVQAEHIPIVMNGDTLEYNAEAFNTLPNDNVEDLLKKLPGVEVEEDGTIKAQGKAVTKITVDGDEFFGDDPKMATKNLPADIVKKVQVFDKKSKKEELTGVKDGEEEEKTINLKLKKDKNKGYFGYVKAGYGTDHRYEGKFSINKFDKKLKISTLGSLNNLNNNGFGFDDYMTFRGDERGRSSEVGVPISRNTGFGNSRFYSGGINLSYKINDKTKIYSNYFYTRNESQRNTETSSEFINDEETYFENSTSNNESKNNRHTARIGLKKEIDSLRNIDMKTNFVIAHGDNSSSFISETLTDLLLKKNDNDRQNLGDNFSFSNNSNISYFRKTKKEGRAYTLSLDWRNSNNTDNRILDSDINYYTDEGVFDFAEILFQEQNSQGRRREYEIVNTYNEPINEKSSIAFNLDHGIEFENNKIDFFDRDSTTLINTFNDDLSNHFSNRIMENEIGATYKFNPSEKLRLSAGVSLKNILLNGNLINEDVEINKTYWVPSPNFNLRKKINKNSYFNTSYSLNTRVPSIRQLQPIVDNSNPLSIYIGNSSLKPELNHRFRTRYSVFNQYNFVTLFTSLNYTITQNNIINAVVVDEFFKRETTPINSNIGSSLSGYLSFSFPVKFIKSKLSINSNFRNSRGETFVNNIQTKNYLNTYYGQLKISNVGSDYFDISAGTSISYNQNKYPSFVSLNTDFFRHSYFTDININIKKTWFFSTSFDYEINSATSFAEQQVEPFWKASVAYSFLKDKKGTLTLSVRDILNRELGIDRTNTATEITQTQTNTLGRYFMLSFNYKLSAFGGNKMYFFGGHRRTK